MTWLHGRDTQLLIFVVSLFLFATLTIDMAQSYLPSEADRSALTLMSENRTGFVTGLMSVFTFLGSTVPLATFALVVASVIGWRAHAWQPPVLTAVTVIGVALLNMQIKQAVDRPRPDEQYQVMEASGYSFPSAHAMSTAAVVGVTAFLIYRTTHSAKVHQLTVVSAATFIFMVAISRIYLGAHWLTDVVGGLALGLACLLALGWAFHRFVPKDALLPRGDKTVAFLRVRSAAARPAL